MSKPHEQDNKSVGRHRAISTDDVPVESGEGYRNWLPIVKQKLLDRESALMNERVEVIVDVILSAYQTFAIRHSLHSVDTLVSMFAAVKKKCQTICAYAVRKMIDAMQKMFADWKEMSTQKHFSSFRAYFQCYRGAFNQNKIKLSIDHFWRLILQKIHELAHNCANDEDIMVSADVRRAFGVYLDITICHALFLAVIQPCALDTRFVWLVRAASYKFLLTYAGDIQYIKDGRNDDQTIRRNYLAKMEVMLGRERSKFETAVAKQRRR